MKAQPLIMLLRIASTMARLPRERNRVPKKPRRGEGASVSTERGRMAWGPRNLGGLAERKETAYGGILLCVAFVDPERFHGDCLIVRSASILRHPSMICSIYSEETVHLFAY